MSLDLSVLKEHEAVLLSRARRLTRNEADARDLLQDTWLLALEAKDRLASPPENVRAWLLVIMRNHWFNVVRNRRVRAAARRALAAAENFDASLVETRAFYRQFERAWNEVSPHARGIATSFLIDGDSQEDVSLRFGMTAGGVAASIHRTRAHLHQSLFGAL
jgi:RNA polymerase sigma-70 factor (ECF subfamily)